MATKQDHAGGAEEGDLGRDLADLVDRADPTGDMMGAQHPQPPTGEKLPLRERLRPSYITGGAPAFPLAVLFGLNAVDELDRTAFTVLLPEIRQHFGLSLTGVVAVSTAAAFVAILIELPIGYYADRKNRVRMATAGALVWTLFTVLTGVAGMVSSLWLLYVARMGTPVGRAFNATHNSLIADYYPIESRTRAYYFHRLANDLGQIVGPLAAGGLALMLAWQVPFFILAIPTLVVVVLAMRLKEPKRGIYERLAAGADEDTAATEEEPAGFGETFRALFNNQSARRIYYSLPFLSASLFGISQLLSLLYEDVYGVGTGGRGLIFAFSQPAGILGLFAGMVLVNRLIATDPGRALQVVSFLTMGAASALVVIGLSPVLGFAIAGHFLFSGVNSMLIPAIYSVVSLAVPPRMRTLGFATGSLWLLLGLPMVLVVTAIGDATSLRVSMVIYAPIFAIAAFLLGMAGRAINIDIEKVQTAAKTQSEAKRRRLEGDPQMLIIRGLNAGYEQTQILFDVDFEVSDGEIIALLGTNGAGKSTLLKAISGIVQPWSGAVIFDGRDITAADASATAQMGVTQVPGGRGIFPSLTVAENLRAAGWMYRKDEEYLKSAIARVIEYFPQLEQRWDTPAGSLSGGEQQMLSLSQAFIARPQLLMIDELSLGLAPTIVERLLDIVRAIHDQGTTIILVEQSVNVALRIAKRAVFMEKGEIRFSGPTEELLHRPDILRAVFLKGASAKDESGEGDKTNGQSRRASARARRADQRRRDALLEQPVVLETQDITKRYGGVTAVNGASFELHKGQVLGLIGPNGAGKTTIFDLISGFAPLDGGRIFLEGKDVTDWPAHRRAASGLSRSFQDARLWPSLTVKEGLAASMAHRVEMTGPLASAFGLPSVTDSEARVDRQVEEVIDLMGLGAFRDKFISELSTGSRRMVELATLIINRPRVIILDEPSSGIAQKETEALGPMLKEVQRYLDCSLLVIEHDMPLLRNLADHVVGLELGTVIAFGTPDEVLNHPRVIESYLGTASYDDLEDGAGNGSIARR